MRLLFVCSQNRLRSPTAERIFATWEGCETDSAGLNNDAEQPLSSELIEWADVIFVMERSHLNRLRKKFKPLLHDKKVLVLDIPDEYEYMDPQLVALLEHKVGPYARRAARPDH